MLNRAKVNSPLANSVRTRALNSASVRIEFIAQVMLYEFNVTNDEHKSFEITEYE